MQVILEVDEAWAIMTLVVSQVLDGVELTEKGKSAVKKWRSDRAEGTPLMTDLAEAMNGELGNVIDKQTSKLVRRKGRFVSTKDWR
jgi:hypothetical protein